MYRLVKFLSQQKYFTLEYHVSSQEIFTYSNTSKKGQEFLKYLTDLSIKATLFVPDNDGLKENEVKYQPSMGV